MAGLSTRKLLILVGLVLCVLGVWLYGQQTGSSSQDQGIPDAPSATRPAQPFPTPPPNRQPSPNSPTENPAPPDSSSAPENNPPTPGAPTEGETNPPPAMPPVTTVPAGSVPESNTSQQDLYKLSVNLNFVQVPVTVKDNDGRLVAGLQAKDFTVLEDGVRQPLKFFTSDPFVMSAAVIVDLGMPDVAVQKVNRTYSALQGAFSPYDEVALYSYSSTVGRISGFTSADQKLTATLNQLKTNRGRNNGPPVLTGPLASGPTINNVPVDQPVQPVITPPKEAHVLNDAMLLAALDLSKRPRDRRKVIFVISEGRELGSSASYADVMKVLLSNNIMVYAIGVEGAALPGYGKLQRLAHLPRYGYSDILPKYANATGGEVFNELSASDIEQAYAMALGDARNQYTLGYTTRATPSSKYRDIEVRVHRPNVKVTAKAGYYPLPPGK